MQHDAQSIQAIAATATAANAASAPRFDLYTGIHKALRHFMHDTLSRLGRLDVADEADMARTLGQLEELLDELRHHVRNENDFVHPAIEARCAGGAARTRGDHAEHLAEIALIEAEARALRLAPAAERPAMALQLYRELAAFVAENLRHMQVEESSNNAALWALYRDDELIALHDRLLASLPPQEMVVVARWMARALAPQELALLCLDMRQKMPPEPFVALLELIRAELDEPRRAKLARALGLAPVPGLVEAHPLAG